LAEEKEGERIFLQSEIQFWIAAQLSLPLRKKENSRIIYCTPLSYSRIHALSSFLQLSGENSHRRKKRILEATGTKYKRAPRIN